MAGFSTRPYQSEAVDAVFREWDKGNRRALLVLPTGTGKTICFCRLIAQVAKRGGRSLILAHRGELLDQAADKLARVTGLGCGVEKAEASVFNGEWWPVVVGSIQTLMRPKRLERFAPDFFRCIIVDEAHHALAETYRRVLDHFSGANVLGVTATPDRGDMRDLGEFFDSLAYEYSLPEAIRDGYLAPIRALTVPLKIDISGVKQQAGDYQAQALGSALDPYLEQIVVEMKKHCAGRKTVVFLPLIVTSQKLQGLLKDAGFRAAEVNGQSQDRAEVLRDFDAGRYDVLCNSMLLTEGWDCPPVDCIVPLRATRIRSLFAQMVGRGTRIHPGKDHLIVLDFLWNTARLDLCRPACLVAETQDVAAKMTEQINATGCPTDLIQAETQAAGDCVADREAALAKRLAEQRRKKGKLVNPLQFEMSIADQDLSGYVPAFGWEQKPPSHEQIEALEKAGLSSENIDNAGKAAALIERIEERRTQWLSTPKQIRMLERYGFQHVGTWSFDAARKMTARISASGWRGAPRGIDPKTYAPTTTKERIPT